MSDRPSILVDADWKGLSGGPRRMGVLHRVVVRGEEVLSFEYANDLFTTWLGRRDYEQVSQKRRSFPPLEQLF